MKRIDGLDRALDLFGTGKDGFKAQVPGVALATQVNPAWFNGIQEAIVRTIEAAGLVLSASDYDQFTSAVDKIAKTRADEVIPSGTRMVFHQTAAPVGWTKDTTLNNRALRIVSGTAGSGGTVDFTTAFASRTPTGTVSTTGSTTAAGTVSTTGSTTAAGTVGSTTLTIAQLPPHDHTITTATGADGGSRVGRDVAAGVATATSSTGGGQGHDHGFTGSSASISATSTFSGSSTSISATSTFNGTAMDFAVKYTDVIIASRD
jgi:hypothetical protein